LPESVFVKAALFRIDFFTGTDTVSPIKAGSFHLSIRLKKSLFLAPGP